MADMILEFRVMPEDSETDYAVLEDKVRGVVENFHNSVKVKSLESENVGFGLQAVHFEIQIDEKCGSESLENELIDLDESGEVNLLKMDRL